MYQIENTIRVLATIMGVVTLLASTISVMILSRQKRGRSQGKGAILRSGLGVLFLTIGLVVLGFLLWKPVSLDVSEQMLFGFSIVGAIFYFCGVGLYLWGLGTMQSQFAVSSLFGAELYKEHKLITSGPFALVRHPLYVGVILTAVGALLIFRTWGMILFMPMSLIVIGRAEQEEKLLAEEFGDEWESYISKVSKWIPRL